MGAIEVSKTFISEFSIHRCFSGGFVVHEAFELSCADGVLELSYRLCLDLPDTLTGDFEDSSDLFQCVCVAVPDAVSQLDNLAFAI